jgi:hypothetical protein
MNKLISFGNKKVSVYDVHRRVEITQVQKMFHNLQLNNGNTYFGRFQVHPSTTVCQNINVEHEAFHNALLTFKDVCDIPTGSFINVYLQREVIIQEDKEYDLTASVIKVNYQDFSDTKVGLLGVSRDNVFSDKIEFCLPNEDIAAFSISPAQLVILEQPNITVKRRTPKCFKRNKACVQDIMIMSYNENQ